METPAENLRLFKYVPPERIDILENEKIAFTPPERFKDPFEFRIGITRQTARNQLKEIISQSEIKAKLTIPGYKKLSHRQRKKGRKEAFREQGLLENFRTLFKIQYKNTHGNLQFSVSVKPTKTISCGITMLTATRDL